VAARTEQLAQGAAITTKGAAKGKKDKQKKAAALPADLRDAVFEIPLLVQTIEEFA
jgi:hypothetical protein